jgi:hypothetical protein|nr:MAG TPA: hypothetical protein [Caudoviricetes sp.]
MADTFYRPLTPQLRSEIMQSIDSNISELNTCQSNALVNMQKNRIWGIEKYYKCLAGRIFDSI